MRPGDERSRDDRARLRHRHAATAVALRLADGSTLQARDDPPPASTPGHATRLLGMADELLRGAGIGWSALERIAVGPRPGHLHGPARRGRDRARARAVARVELVGVSSLRALAEPGCTPHRASAHGVLAVLDARRGEVFAAAYERAGRRDRPRSSCRAARAGPGGAARASCASRGRGASAGAWLAIGDGAVRFRGELEAAGVSGPAGCLAAAPRERARRSASSERGAGGAPASEAILPDYRRRPDAEIALERKRAWRSRKPPRARPGG